MLQVIKEIVEKALAYGRKRLTIQTTYAKTYWKGYICACRDIKKDIEEETTIEKQIDRLPAFFRGDDGMMHRVPETAAYENSGYLIKHQVKAIIRGV